MTVRIAIVGLGQIGASAGLALARHKEQVTTVGHDKSPEVARTAKKIGAVEKVEYNLPASVDGADIILLALPVDQIFPTLKAIARDVRQGVVLMDTSPVKSMIAAWVKELLPPECHYVGLTPAINPLYVEAAGTGVNAAHADLFQHGLMGICAPQGTASEALQLATNFSALLGAKPFYTDIDELDGVMASAHLLPHLTAAALANAILDQPGWPDIRKVAGRPFAIPTALLSKDEVGGLGEAALGNRQNVVRVLDSLLAALKDLRDDIAGEDGESLMGRLEHAQGGREKWWSERAKGDWLSVEYDKQEMPTLGSLMKQQIGGLGKFFKRGEKSDTD